MGVFRILEFFIIGPFFIITAGASFRDTGERFVLLRIAAFVISAIAGIEVIDLIYQYFNDAPPHTI